MNECDDSTMHNVAKRSMADDGYRCCGWFFFVILLSLVSVLFDLWFFLDTLTSRLGLCLFQNAQIIRSRRHIFVEWVHIRFLFAHMPMHRRQCEWTFGIAASRIFAMIMIHKVQYIPIEFTEYIAYGESQTFIVANHTRQRRIVLLMYVWLNTCKKRYSVFKKLTI